MDPIGDPRNLLRLNREALVRDIKSINPILDSLFRNGKITEEEMDEIRAETTPQDKVRRLLDVISSKDTTAYYRFREALKISYPHLENILHRCPIHNERLKLYCEVCEHLLCFDCKSGHSTHRCTSITAEADDIRTCYASFIRENRRKISSLHDEELTFQEKQRLCSWAADRQRSLEAKIRTMIEQESNWFTKKIMDRPSTSATLSSLASSVNPVDHQTMEAACPTFDMFHRTGQVLKSNTHCKPSIKITDISKLIRENKWLPHDDLACLQRLMKFITCEKSSLTVWCDAEVIVYGKQMQAVTFTAGDKANKYVVHLRDVPVPSSLSAEHGWCSEQHGDVIIWSKTV
ncbi:uncharacterized protein LOC118426814 [Branchiostoma floridae]|uniref:Uncharacterized protein LOC118426814 n=1 Tax=Branchiostoma floridae TaxID=7739 RepID=A0A9J7N6X6_BRAFL|nr:uncharacterized protein LOC118426814 [Branchiostoma floridae]